MDSTEPTPGKSGRTKSGIDGHIYLTFDDGPDPIWTPKVLAALHLFGARATFFVIAPLAIRFPRLIHQMIRAGHSVELHCARHIRHTELTNQEIEDDARNGLEDLRALGVLPRLWRPPWGVVTLYTQAVAEVLALELVSWSVDTHDWRGDTAAEMLDSARPDLQPGAVILMHDGLGPGARRSGCQETVALIGKVVEHARSLRCEPSPIGDSFARLSSRRLVQDFDLDRPESLKTTRTWARFAIRAFCSGSNWWKAGRVGCRPWLRR